MHKNKDNKKNLIKFNLNLCVLNNLIFQKDSTLQYECYLEL